MGEIEIISFLVIEKEIDSCLVFPSIFRVLEHYFYYD